MNGSASTSTSTSTSNLNSKSESKWDECSGEGLELEGLDDYTLKHLVLHGIPHQAGSMRARVWQRLLLGSNGSKDEYSQLTSWFDELIGDDDQTQIDLNSISTIYHDLINTPLPLLISQQHSDSHLVLDSDPNSDFDFDFDPNSDSNSNSNSNSTSNSTSTSIPNDNSNHNSNSIQSPLTLQALLRSLAQLHPPPLPTHLFLTRLLSIWSFLNPALPYQHSLAIIAATLFSVFSLSTNPSSSPEQITFVAFSSLIPPLATIFSSTTKYHDGLARLCAQYSSQLASIDPSLSAHLHNLAIEPELYLPNWLRSLFIPCLPPPDLLILWDVLFALNLDAHPSPSNLSDALIDLSCALTILIGPRLSLQSRKANLLHTLLNIRAESIPVSDIVNQLLAIRQRRLAQAFAHPQPTFNQDHSDHDLDTETETETDTEQNPLWLGLSRLKTLATESVQKPSGIGPQSPGLFGKLRTKAEGWKDSDAAAALSKRATNWSIMASSWRTPTVLIKQPPELPPASSPSEHAAHYTSPSSARWSKVSTASTLSLDSRPPVSSASSLSCSSSRIGSPVHQNISTPGGTKPLLLSARARTNVPLGPEPNGLVHEMVASSLKRLSALKLGTGQPRMTDDDRRVIQRPHPIVTRTSAVDLLLSPSPPLTGIGGLGRHRAQSVLTSPTSEHGGQVAGRRNGRISLPELYSPSRERNGLVEPVLVEEEDDSEVGFSNGLMPIARGRSRTLVGCQIGAKCGHSGEECTGARYRYEESEDDREQCGGDEVDAYVSLYDS